MDPNQRMLPPSTSAVTIEVSLNKRRKDLPADSISAIQVKHDASVSMRLPLFSPTRYRSEAFLVLSSTSPSARETKFVNHLEHIPNAYAVASRGSKFTRGALRSNGEECSECVSDHSKELNDGADCKSHETEEAQGRRVKFNLDSRGSEEKARKKQNALDRDTKRHCSPLRRQNRVHFDNENVPAHDSPTSEARAESMASSSRQGDKETQDRREEGTHGNWSPINELQQIIEEEKEQQSLPNDATSTEPCEQLETSTDSVESGSEVNPLWVLDSITASVEKCSSPAYDTIFEEEVENDIVLDGHADGITQGACSSTFGGTEREGTASQNQEEEGKDKRLSQGSDGSFGFEPHYEEDFSGYVEGKEYFKNLPTFHRLLTSAEKEELDDEQRQKNELAALRLEDQIPGLHEQSDYAQDMMDTHAMRSEYWDYPYPSRCDAFDTAMRSEDKNELLENMRMKIRGRLRQPGNSSSDSGCQDTDANHSSLDESEAANRLNSPKGRHQGAVAEDKTKTPAETDNLSIDLSDEREKNKVKTRQEKEASSPEHPSSKRRQILEGLSRLIASSEETGLPIPEDSTLESGTEERRNCIESRSVNEAPTIPVRPMIHGHLQFVHYENITIVKKRTDQERNPHESNKSDETHINTQRSTQSPEIMRENESSKSGKADSRVAHSRNMESIAEPIDIDLSDPEVLEATKRMQLAFRKRRGPHGSRKFRSLQRMRAESDSVSDRILGIDSSTSFDKPTPFPVEVSLESRKVQMSRHHSLPTNLTHPPAEYNLNGDHSLSTKPKNTNTTKERLCKKLSRQKSVSLYPSSPSLLIEKPKKELTEREVVNQPERMDKCETSNQSMVLSEKEDVKKMSQNQCTSNGLTTSTTVTEMVKSNNALGETTENEDLDVKLKCISNSGETLTNNSETAPVEPVPNSEQEPDIDLKDPKVQDASKMIQQAFRRKKLLSKRSRGSVEEKANKKVQANKVSAGNAASNPNTSSLEETLNTLHSERSASPSILYADTTVNVVIAEVDHDTVSNEHHPVDQIQNKSTETRTMANEPPPVIKSASVNYQIYKGVMIVDDQLSNPLDRHPKPPLTDKENIVQVEADATFHSSFEKNKVVKRASSISEASLGDEIDIDLLDAEVKAVTEKLRSVSSVEKSPNGVRIQDHAATNETVQELNNGDAENQILPNSDPQSLNALAKEPPVIEKEREKPKTNESVDIDLSDPDVQKTAFKLQSAFWKKRTSSKIKSPKGAMAENSNKANKSTGKSMSTGATTKNKNESVIESKDGKGKSREDQSNCNELDINSKDTGESQNETSKTNQRLTSSLTCKEHEKKRQSATNNDSMGARPQSPNTNTVSLPSKSSKQTEKIDIDLNDSKVKEATKKIQKIFKRKRTPTKTGETSSKGEPKKPVIRLKSNIVVSLGSKHQTKPMISTSFLDRSENGRKEAKAAMVSPDCHGNTDDDEGTKWSSNKGAVEELQKPNDGLADDNKMTHPKGEQGDQTELLSTTKESLLPSIDEYVSSKTDSTSEHKTPSTQRDDEHGGGSLVMNDVINSVPSSSDQSSVDKGLKGEKFSHDYNGSRSVSSVYADVDPSPMLPASSTSSLLRMQDEVDIENLITTSMTTREANGVIRNVSPATCFPTSLTTAPLSRRNRDRDDDADSLRLKSSSTAVTHAKSVHGYLEQASDDTEYETAYSDFSDRVDDELERTLVKDDVISTELIQMETTIHHHSPRFLIRPKNASCCHGDRARFVCCITGTPRPDISWFASGKVIRPERNNRLQITDYSEDNDGNSNACALVSILDIVEVKFLDNGEYACVAINSQGQAFSSAHLTVAEPDPGPVEESAEDENDRLSSQNNNGASAKVDMESSLQDLVHVSSASLPRQKVQALVGSKASFFCPVEGDPPLDVKWFKDDVPITSNHDDDRITGRVEGCVHCLHIQDISLSDQGTYVCSAANDRGSVLCVSLLEVQESSELINGNHQVKQHTPMLVITEPEKFRQPLENNAIVPLQAKTEETVVPFDSSNVPNTNESNHHGRTNSDEGEVKVVGDAETEDINNVLQTNSGAENNGNSDEILSSVLSTYGPRDLPESHSDDRLSVLSNEGVTFKESNGSENYASAEGPPSDENQQTKNKIANGTIPYEGDSLLEAKHHKSSKRRSSRRNHVKSPTKNNHSTSPGDKDVIEDIGLDDANGLIRSKSSRKKRSSSRRKKSPIHSKNVERVRLDLEKAEELTEKVDSCLDIIDDLLTLTSYDENENETEEKLRQKLDTLVHKFADSESDAASLSSRRSTPSHRRKEKLRKVDLLQLSDSNGECLDASDVNLNVSRIQSDGNIWGPCSLEDSLKVMSDLVGNISVTVREQEQKADYPANANSTETVTNDQEENLNNNNNTNRKGIPNKGLHSGQNVKRTPLRELLKHSLFSQELMTTRIRRRPLPVTRSLDSVDDYTNIPRTSDGRRRHSFSSLYAPTTSRPARHPFLRTLSIRRRNRAHSMESSSSDDDSPDRFRGVNIVRRPRPLETGRASDDCPSHAESTDSLPVELEDKFQQFPDGDRLSSPIGFEDSDCSLEDHNLPDRIITTRFVNNGNFIPGRERLSEYVAVETEPELSKDSVGEDSPSTSQHKIGGVSQSANDISKRCTDNDQEYVSKHKSILQNSSKTGDITLDNESHNGTHSDRIPQENGSYTQDKDVDEDDDDHADTLLNVSRNDSGFSSGPLATDRLDNFF